MRQAFVCLASFMATYTVATMVGVWNCIGLLLTALAIYILIQHYRKKS
ncbi:hypothetical protein [Spirosoma fluminis]